MLHLDLATRTAVVGALYTATDVEGGQTKEQRNLLEALARHVMRVPPSAAVETSPREAAAAIAKPRLRKAVGEILVMLELVRHPPSAALITSEYGRYVKSLGDPVAGRWRPWAIFQRALWAGDFSTSTAATVFPGFPTTTRTT